jgi:hypothetical protein
MNSFGMPAVRSQKCRGCVHNQICSCTAQRNALDKIYSGDWAENEWPTFFGVTSLKDIASALDDGDIDREVMDKKVDTLYDQRLRKSTIARAPKRRWMRIQAILIQINDAVTICP